MSAVFRKLLQLRYISLESDGLTTFPSNHLTSIFGGIEPIIDNYDFRAFTGIQNCGRAACLPEGRLVGDRLSTSRPSIPSGASATMQARVPTACG
jgi:hypothetical protein